MPKLGQRCFQLTMTVYLWEGETLPESFRDWIDRAGLCHDGASSTRLDGIIEMRYPLADDVVEKRKTSFKYSPWL